MNKKFIVSLLVSLTIIAGITMPVYAKEQPKSKLNIECNMGYPQNDNVFVIEQLMAKGYPTDGIHYDFTTIHELGGGKTFLIRVYADGLLVSNANITLKTTPSGATLIDGTSSESIKKLAAINWTYSKEDAIYYARYAVYKNTYKNVTEDQVKIENLSLIKINGEDTPCYSLKVSYNENNEHWRVLINAENGDIIDTSKVK